MTKALSPMKMNRQVEIRWVIFLFSVLLVAFGLLGGFSFSKSFDFQMYETYYIITNFQLLILLTGLLTFAYLMTLGLKKMSLLNKSMKITSIVIFLLVGLVLTVSLLLFALSIYTSSAIKNEFSNFGIIALMLGLIFLFLKRTKEISRIS